MYCKDAYVSDCFWCSRCILLRGSLSSACETWKHVFPKLVFSISDPEHMFWEMPPSTSTHRSSVQKAFMTTDEWREKKKILDVKESNWSCHDP